MRASFFIFGGLTAILAFTGCATRNTAANIPVTPLPEQAGTTAGTEESAGDLLLGEVLTRMPGVPVEIEGRIWTKGRRRKKIELALRADLYVRGRSAKGHYFISLADGSLLEELDVIRDRGKRTVYTYKKGDPPAETALGSLSSSIHGTDITWLDLSLSFLWWRNSRIIAMGKAKGRSCYVLDVMSPADEPGERRNLRLWIDKKHRMLLRALEYDAVGTPSRRLSVKSFKKIDDEWMIKDIEVEDLKSETRTMLRIENITALEPDGSS